MYEVQQLACYSKYIEVCKIYAKNQIKPLTFDGSIKLKKWHINTDFFSVHNMSIFIYRYNENATAVLGKNAERCEHIYATLQQYVQVLAKKLEYFGKLL